MPQQIDFDPNVDYYKAIGVAKDATADEIKKAYRKLAKANHPDSTGGDKAKESRFKDISNAYDVLGDAKKRALYDQLRAQGSSRPFGRGGGGGVYTSQGPGPGVFDLGDLFRVFQGGGRWPGSAAPVDFDDEGPTVRQRAGGGRRRAPVEDVPPEQKANASDGTPLEVKGSDVYSDVRISFDRAILGTVATVPTIEGKAEVKIPPGSSSGKKLRLRGKGITDRAGRAGDHYITVQIDVPGHLDDDQKKQLIQLVTRLRKREQND
jgi:molecular chaperone DnaJ